jgi:cytochrome b561
MLDTIAPGGVASGYSLWARVFHWVIAALVLTMIPIGIVMANVDLGPAGDRLYDIHRSIGVIVLPLAVIRLIYRWQNPPPPLPDDIPAAQQIAAHATHWGLYALLIIQPIIGWIATSAYRAPITVFWLFQVPPIWPVDQPFSEAMFKVHRNLGFLMAALLCAHIGAALYHHVVRKDRVLMRMVSG